MPNLVGMAVCYHEVMCHVKKIVHYLQCQGHSEGSYNQNMTIFYNIFKTAVLFATKLGLIVQHHKLECPVEKWDYCVQGQGHSESSKYSDCLPRQYLLIHRTFCCQTLYGYATS